MDVTLGNFTSFNVAGGDFTERIHIKAVSFPVLKDDGTIIEGTMETRIVRPDDIQYAQAIPASYDFLLYRDSDFSETVTYESSSGVAYDLTGCTLTAYAYCPDDSSMNFNINVTVVNATEGTFKLHLDYNEIAAIPLLGTENQYVTTNYNYYVTITTSSNTKIRIMQGVMVVSL